ncbi:MAG TPA: DNA primase DnaG [Candidatus Nanoarchaeia archaeon]|nr:DNA primase DnaG [Candidatus Nanoarchaeia archaeon]
MGKVSPVSTKYIIHTNISIDGIVDRPDVIGAIFGQTEGFLGQDLELRELQRSGKVGRIEVKVENSNGKSSGQIIIPCSLDKAEAAIIAAALETIERIGPCNSKVKVDKIEDVRVSKRGFVIARAKELLMNLQANVLPDSQEITEEVSQSVRMMEIIEWGRDRLPAGPGIDDSEEIILVEGRADVLNLLKQGFKNVVSVNGTSIPDSIKELCRKKTVTLFVDGDRGGDIIIKELTDSTEVDYITKAPAGKEVEELTKKEIHIALRARIAAEQFRFEVDTKKTNGMTSNTTKKPNMREVRDNMRDQYREGGLQRQAQSEVRPVELKIDSRVREGFKEMLDSLIGTRGAYILDKDSNILGKVPTTELESTLKGLSNAEAVVFDGMITRELARAAESSRVNYLVGMNSSIRSSESRARIITHREL